MTSIYTEHLTMRPLKKATPRQTAWLRDPEVVRYSEQRHHTHTLSSQLRYIEQFGGKSHLWGIYRIKDGEHIGNISALHDEPNDVSDVGIMIGETACWHSGYGREAWNAVCNWLLDPNLGAVRKLEAGCMGSNLAMIKIIRKSGFIDEGIRANHFMVDGGPVSMLLFGRSK